MIVRIFYYLLCLLIISGCATTQSIQKPTSSLPAPGMARISLERGDNHGSMFRVLDIVDNGMDVGEIAVNGNLTWDRPPGIMNLTVKPMWLYPLTTIITPPMIVDVRAGYQYNIRAKWGNPITLILASSSKISGYDEYASNPNSKPIPLSTETAQGNSAKESKQLAVQVPSSEAKTNKVYELVSVKLGKYYALVIGINDYKHLPKLQTATNDARVVRDILKDDYGFEVELLIDASRSDILLSLSKLRERLATTDNLLIYYAGHGWLDKDGDEGYWLPSDASQSNEVNWVSNASVTTALKAMLAKHVLVVADSCYSGKLGRSVHIQMRNPDYYSRLSQKRARSVISSGGLEPVIDSGGKGSHSVFASAFIRALQENKAIMDSTELFGNIRRPIMLNSDQTPEYSDIRKADHDGGEFIFVKMKK